MSPVSFLQRPARWMQLLASNTQVFSAAPNIAFELAARKTSDDDMAGLDLGDVHTIVNGCRTRTTRDAASASPSDSPDSTCTPRRYAPHMGWRRPRCTWRPASRVNHRNRIFRIRGTDRRPREAVRERRRYTAGRLRRAAVADGADRRPRDQYRVSGGTVGEIWVHGDNVCDGLLGNPRDRAHFRRNACRSVGRHTRRAVAENRRLGLHLRRRAVHHRPDQGSLDRLRAQPLSRRHRGDDPGDHPRPLRGDSGSG